MQRTILILFTTLSTAGCTGSETFLGSTDTSTDSTVTDPSTDTITSETYPDSTTDPGFPVGCPGGSTTHELTALDPSMQLDVLVVMDNSRSMGEEQAGYTEAFVELIRSLLDPPDADGDTLPDRAPISDLHIGIVSTDMGTGGYTVETCSDPVDGDDGILRHTPNPLVPGCAPTYPTYLSTNWDPPDTGAIDELSRAFECIATLGTNGCGFEQQLKAASRAIEHTHPAGPNAGFLRAESMLLFIFVTDEEDCSVSDPHIFDTADSTMGHMNLRCFLHPYMVQPVEQYINTFQSYRADPDRLQIAVIAGVPLDPACEGRGDRIDGCLAHPLMIEHIDPYEPTRLAFSCNTAMGYAMPPRRLVQVAQAFGKNSYVRSLCTDDFTPAIDGLTAHLREVIEGETVPFPRAAYHPEADPCRCEVGCRLVEKLVDLRPCPPIKTCWQPDGPGTGCETMTDEDGISHTLCEIPQAGSQLVGCSPYDPIPIPPCDDAGTIQVPEGTGWYYIDPPAPGAGLHFTEMMAPEEGSDVFLICCN